MSYEEIIAYLEIGKDSKPTEEIKALDRLFKEYADALTAYNNANNRRCDCMKVNKDTCDCMSKVKYYCDLKTNVSMIEHKVHSITFDITRNAETLLKYVHRLEKDKII